MLAGAWFDLEADQDEIFAMTQPPSETLKSKVSRSPKVEVTSNRYSLVVMAGEAELAAMDVNVSMMINTCIRKIDFFIMYLPERDRPNLILGHWRTTI